MAMSFYKKTQQMLHSALPAQRRKRHVPNSSSASNGTGASTAPTNPPHCKNHLLPNSPIQVSCSLNNCVSFHKKRLLDQRTCAPTFDILATHVLQHIGVPQTALFTPKAARATIDAHRLQMRSVPHMRGKIRIVQTGTYLAPTLVAKGMHSNKVWPVKPF